jgi:hypothetical protein
MHSGNVLPPATCIILYNNYQGIIHVYDYRAVYTTVSSKIEI